MRWFTVSPAVVGFVLTLGIASSAQAEPAMFEASLILHAWGNDETKGSKFPSNTYTLYAMPLGYDCYNYRRTSWGKTTPPRPLYCPQSLLHKGHPATGVGVLVQGIGATPSLQLSQSALRVTTTGLLYSYGYTHYVSETYATFANAAGTFFAGGGPAATGKGKGRVTHIGTGPRLGTWIIRQGKHGFGGPMGLLGKFGAKQTWGASIGGFSATTSWNMIRALGRSAADPDRTFTNTGTYRFHGGHGGTITKVATGTPWTTGTVTLYASKSGFFPTVLRRAGYDNRTALGFGNLQLVTPSLTHWNGFGHTGHIGILNIRISAPEPSRWLLLAAGLGCLAALHRVRRH
ncbi:MAG: hypothetical protein OEM49_06915 [Myxococcales bacterium]|nr:hypothetical protein [Myxococcales bacterium]MDH5305983.1 hypothetical protein [Myxococcales bacterium]